MCEEEKKRKQLEREKKRVAELVAKTQPSGCGRRGRGRGRGRRAGRGTQRRIEDFDPLSPSSSESDSPEASITDSKDKCPVCGVPENEIMILGLPSMLATAGSTFTALV